jgi:ATP-dependent Clp protease ATP-binding subunit ClpA
MLFGAKNDDETDVEARREIQIDLAVKKHLRPELINRLSAVVKFHSLGIAEARLIVEKCLSVLNERLKERELDLYLQPETIEFLIQKGFSPEYGAREMERIFEQYITRPFAEEILDGSTDGVGRMVAHFDGDYIFFREANALFQRRCRAS